MSHLRTIRVLLAGLLLLGTMLAAAPVSAQATPPPRAPGEADAASGPAFVLRPVDGEDGDFVAITAEPGAAIEQRILIGNAGDEPIRLRTYVADTVPVDNGGYSVSPADVAPSGTATWVTWPTEELSFQPGEAQERALSVRIPADALPGQHIAGLVLETADPTAIGGSEQFTQVVRKSIAVLITVPGPETPALALGEPAFAIEGPNEILRIPVANTGNVLVKPAGELTVRDAAGETVLTRPVAMRSVYAGTETAIAFPLDAPLADGDYTVTLALTDGATGTTASLEASPLTISRESDAPPVLTIAGGVTLQPEGDAPVYADVAVEIVNSGTPVEAAEVVLEVARDGEPVEAFTLVPSLALAQGTTTTEQRYIPPQGFATGEWTFTLRLNTVDASGTSITVATFELPPATVAP